MMVHSLKRLISNLRSEDSSSGFTLIEVLVAISIFAIGLLGVAALQLHVIKNNTTGRFSMDAMAWTAENIEQFIVENWDDVKNQSALSFSAKDAGGDNRDCEIAWTVSEHARGFKVVTVTTSWQNKRASRKSVTFDFIKPEL